jgi:hypothetical protein
MTSGCMRTVTPSAGGTNFAVFCANLGAGVSVEVHDPDGRLQSVVLGIGAVPAEAFQRAEIPRYPLLQPDRTARLQSESGKQTCGFARFELLCILLRPFGEGPWNGRQLRQKTRQRSIMIQNEPPLQSKADPRNILLHVSRAASSPPLPMAMMRLVHHKMGLHSLYTSLA